MESPEQRDLVKSYLRSNAEALRLLHAGITYQRCAFPINLLDGEKALLPHLPACKRAAQLLSLESVASAYQTNAHEAGESLLVALHLAQILQDEPTLVGVPTRDGILATTCLAVQADLNHLPMPERQLAQIAAPLGEVMAEGAQSTKNALVNERCFALFLFQGSNQQIADFLQQGQSSLGLRLSVEMLRVMGNLQRDAAFYVRCMDQIEAGAMASEPADTLAALDEVESDVESNQHLVSVDKTRVNIISCMMLPGVIKAMRQHIWTRALLEATVVTLAVEQYREDVGRLPADILDLVPRYLPKVPGGPYSGQQFRLRLLPRGYAV